jgi:hypothetical protein
MYKYINKTFLKNQLIASVFQRIGWKASPFILITTVVSTLLHIMIWSLPINGIDVNKTNLNLT